MLLELLFVGGCDRDRVKHCVDRHADKTVSVRTGECPTSQKSSIIQDQLRPDMIYTALRAESDRGESGRS